MVEIVDSIVAELIVRDNGYIATFERATKAHQEFKASVPKKDGLEALAAGAQQYAAQHNKAVGSAAAAETQAAVVIGKAKKSVSDATKATAAAAKQAAKDQAEAAKLAATAEARFYAAGTSLFERVCWHRRCCERLRQGQAGGGSLGRHG
jgi:hypothetical protein